MAKSRNNEPNNVQIPPRSKWSKHAASLLRTLATDSRRKRARKILRSIKGLESSEKANSIKVKDAIRFYNFLLKFFDEHNDEIVKQSMEKEKESTAKPQNITRSVTTRTSKRKRMSQPAVKYARIKSSLSASSKNSKATKVSVQLSENSDFDESQDTLNSKCYDNDSHSESSITSNSISSSSIQDNEDFFNQHNELCEVCGIGGELLCCCTCTLVFHIDCIRPSLRVVPRRSWSCAYCISSGLKGHKKDTKVRRRALQAIRQMAKITMQKKNAMSLQLANDHAAKDKDSGDDGPTTRHSTPPSTPDNSHKSQDSDDIKGLSNLPSAMKKVVSASDSNLPRFKRNTYLLYDSLTPKEIVSHNKRSTRRVRRQPTLFDPQSCPASEWKSDSATTKSNKQSRRSSKRKEHYSCDDKKREKIDRISSLIKITDINDKMNFNSTINRNDDTKRTEMWCSFCADDKLTSVCCFCGCRVCFSKNDEKNLLICDKCDGEYHIYCLNPPLSSIPEAKTWFCSYCKSSEPSNDDTLKNKSLKSETKGNLKSSKNSKSLAFENSSIIKSENRKEDESCNESSPMQDKEENDIKSNLSGKNTSRGLKKAEQKSPCDAQISPSTTMGLKEKVQEIKTTKSSHQQKPISSTSRASKQKKASKSLLFQKNSDKVSKRMKQKFSIDVIATGTSAEMTYAALCVEPIEESIDKTCKDLLPSNKKTTDLKVETPMLHSEKSKITFQTNLQMRTNPDSSSKPLVENVIEGKEISTMNDESRIKPENKKIIDNIDSGLNKKEMVISNKTSVISSLLKVNDTCDLSRQKKEVAISASSSEQLKKPEIKATATLDIHKESVQLEKKCLDDTTNEQAPQKGAQSRRIASKLSTSSAMEGCEETLQTMPSFNAADNKNTNSTSKTGKKSRSGRSIKRNSFHDEVEEGEQHLRSQRYIIEQQKKALSVIEQKNKKLKEEKKINSISPKNNDHDIDIQKSAMSPSHGNSSSQFIEQELVKAVPKQKEIVASVLNKKKQEQIDKPCPTKSNPITSLPPTVNAMEPINILPEDTAKASMIIVNDVVTAPNLPPNTTTPDLTTSNTEVAITPKVPRRKPGARECMQISRRFGVQVIQQKYMDTLLDYCLRGKVEHLIRMRERLDEHSNMLEEQLAGLETLVLERGELDIEVPPPKISTISSMAQNGDHSSN